MREKIKDAMKSALELVEIPDDITTQNCPQWDSLHHLSLVIELESIFDVAFEPEEIAKMKNLEIIEEVIKSKNK